MTTFTSPYRPVILLGIWSLLSLISAYILEFGFGFAPCELCLWQRIPYWIVIGLGLAAAALMRCKHSYHERSAVMALLSACLFAFLAGTGIAFYHSGVEQGWFEGLSGCSGGASEADSMEDLREAIRRAPLVRCDEPEFMLLGFSLSNWNALASLLLSVITLRLMMRKH